VKIEKLYKSQKVADRWYAELENGETIRVSLAIVADYSLYKGRELTDDELSALRDVAAESGAKSRALRMLGTRQMSRRELVDKLTQKGETEENAAAAADFMERIGAVNDEEYSKAIVRHYSKKGYGAARIKQELSRRGIPRELWDEALCELPEGDEAIDALIARKLAGREPDKREVKRLTDMLLRRGFSWGQIKAALGRYDEALEEME